MHRLPLVLLLLAGAAHAQYPTEPRRLEPPRSYVVHRALTPPRIDGRLEESEWRASAWTDDFVDIEGTHLPPPPLRTRARMLWDAQHLYIGAQLTEPHVWATLTERDAVIYHDDDFEVFIDPDGDTHNYYELEVNALGTVWDLMLTRPYRDGGTAIDAWDIRGLQVAVHVQGTINDARDRDSGWSVELAIPWAVLREAAPGGRAPQAGEQWRLNFSRVDWDVDSAYRKRIDPATQKPLPEHNWVWSPQGAINMHMPDRWGIVQFAAAGDTSTRVSPDPLDGEEQALRTLYYAQRRFRSTHGRYATTLAELELRPEASRYEPLLQATQSGYEITIRKSDGSTLHIREDGRSWRMGGAR